LLAAAAAELAAAAAAAAAAVITAEEEDDDRSTGDVDAIDEERGEGIVIIGRVFKQWIAC